MTTLLESLTMAAPTHSDGLSEQRWIQVLSHLDPKYGGISSVVPELVDGLAEVHVQSKIACFCKAGQEYVPRAAMRNAIHFWPVERQKWIFDPSRRHAFEHELKGADGLHVHGLWDATSAIASKAAWNLRKPYLLSAHGMLEPWALAHGKWKKRIYSALVERDVVRRARCLHALTHTEAMQYRAYTGSQTPAVVIPNGVTVPDTLSSTPFLHRFPVAAARRLVLFLGRLHPKKGVDLLADAWIKVATKVPEAMLVLAGPDSEGLRRELEEKIEAARIAESVLFTGMLDPAMKWSALAAAECMVLPSHSEGLSMSLLEALGAGVPVIATPYCNMPWVSEIGAGWLTAPETNAIGETLLAVLGQRMGTNRAAGAIGRVEVAAKYSWTAVAERMREAYLWCLGGPIPARSEVMA